MPAEVRTITPYLPPAILSKLCAFIRTKQEQGESLRGALRALDMKWRDEPWSLQLRTTALVLADLLDQGWKISARDRAIELTPPGLRSGVETAEDAKLRLRHALQVGQKRQLHDPSVQKFLKNAMAQRWRGGVKSSVLDLVDDGADLARLLRAARNKPREATLKDLRRIIRPSVELVTEDARCATTGLRLMDIWRFFRHTWSLEYRSIPGRQLPLLVRNDARPNRPVIGIAQLASPILRTRPRDNWLQWTPEPFVRALQDGVWPIDDTMDALRHRIIRSAEEIRFDDLASAEEIANPTESAVFRLEQRAAGAAVLRENSLKEIYRASGRDVRSQKDDANQEWTEEEWFEASGEVLYVRKRAETLARLLRAKLTFTTLSRDARGEELLDRLLQERHGAQALSAALQEVRKAGLASQIADLSVCGAVAPYNAILGGKLVALLAASREAHEAWKAKYEEQVSIISSQMAGRPVCRPADLKVLTTTSLYGRGSSQYNRLRLQAGTYRGLKDGLEWKQLEETTAGYGTVHLGTDTVQRLREFSEDAYGARRINNRFGEGTSPRLRQIREGLDALGIESNDVLNHATPRLFYACALTDDAKEQLIGFGTKVPRKQAKSDQISDAWRERWLYSRIQSDDILDQVAARNSETVRNDLRPSDETGQLLLSL
ncbi:MAG: DUF4338 domain-containing protein [Amaricoccus sp.]